MCRVVFCRPGVCGECGDDHLGRIGLDQLVTWSQLGGKCRTHRFRRRGHQRKLYQCAHFGFDGWSDDQFSLKRKYHLEQIDGNRRCHDRKFTGIAYLFPTTLNISSFTAYLVLAVYYIFFKKRAYGLVTHSQTGQQVPFAMLSVYDATDSQKRVTFSVSDVLGRYFILVENGEYLLKASGNFLGGSRFEKTERIRITDGIVRSDVAV